MESNNSKRLKVALAAASIRTIGGQSIQAKRLFDSFTDNPAIELIFIENNPTTIFQNISILRTIFASFKFWFSLLSTIPGVDVVHTFASGSSGYVIATLPVLFFAELFRKPVILNYHSGELEQHIAEWRLTALPTMKLFNKIVVPSKFLVEVFAKHGIEAEAIFNSVDAENFRFRERNPLHPVFLSNRNFEAHYQVSDVLRAFQLIKREIPKAKLIVAGSGSESAKLRELAAELQLSDIEFLGAIDPIKMPDVYDRADIYLNSSIVDNMPLSLIEAFTSGLAVVSTNAGGIPFIVENEKTGLLVEKADFESLANSALRLLEDRDLAQTIIKNGLGEITKYDKELLRDLWIELYREVKECE